jgi:hypothetical protein
VRIASVLPWGMEILSIDPFFIVEFIKRKPFILIDRPARPLQLAYACPDGGKRISGRLEFSFTPCGIIDEARIDGGLQP